MALASGARRGTPRSAGGGDLLRDRYAKTQRGTGRRRVFSSAGDDGGVGTADGRAASSGTRDAPESRRGRNRSWCFFDRVERANACLSECSRGQISRSNSPRFSIFLSTDLCRSAMAPRVKNVDFVWHSAAHAMVSSPPRTPSRRRCGSRWWWPRRGVRWTPSTSPRPRSRCACPASRRMRPGVGTRASAAGGRPEARHAGVARGALRRHLVARHLPPRAQPRREARHRRRLRVQGGRPDRAALELGRARRGTLFSRCFRDQTRAGAYARVRAEDEGDGGLRGKRARARVRQRRRGVGVGGRVQRQAGRASRRRGEGAAVGRFVRRRKVRSAVFHPAPRRRAGAETRRGLHLASETTEESITNTFAVSVAAGVEHSVAVDAAGGAWSWGSDAYGQCGRRKKNGAPAPACSPRPARLEGLFRGGARVVAAAAGKTTTLLLDETGRVWRCFSNAASVGAWAEAGSTFGKRPSFGAIVLARIVRVRSRVRGAPRRHARRADARARAAHRPPRRRARLGPERRRRDGRRRLRRHRDGVTPARRRLPRRRRGAQSRRLRAPQPGARVRAGACTGSGRMRRGEAGRARGHHRVRLLGRCGSRCRPSRRERAGDKDAAAAACVAVAAGTFVENGAGAPASFSFSRGVAVGASRRRAPRTDAC